MNQRDISDILGSVISRGPKSAHGQIASPGVAQAAMNTQDVVTVEIQPDEAGCCFIAHRPSDLRAIEGRCVMLTDSELNEMYHKADCGSLDIGRGTLMDLIAQARLAVAKEAMPDVPAGSETAAVLGILEQRYQSRRAEFGKHPTTDQMAVLAEIESIERLVKRELLTLRNQPTAAEARDKAFAEVLGILKDEIAGCEPPYDDYGDKCAHEMIAEWLTETVHKIEQLRSGAKP
jgi:hypothetical protein